MSLEAIMSQNNSIAEANQQAIEMLTAANATLTAAVSRLSSLMEQMIAGASALRGSGNTERAPAQRDPYAEVAQQMAEPAPENKTERTVGKSPVLGAPYGTDAEPDEGESEYSRRARGVPAGETRDEPKKRRRRTNEQIAADAAREAIQAERDARAEADAKAAREEEDRNNLDYYDRREVEEAPKPRPFNDTGRLPSKQEMKTVPAKRAEPVEIDERTFKLRCREFATTTKIEPEERDAGINAIKAQFGTNKVVEVDPADYHKVMWALDKFENGDRVNFREYDEDQALNAHGRDGDDI